MTEKTEKATRAEALQASKLFQEYHQETVEEQVKIFENTDAKMEDTSEAHAMLRALGKLKAKMARAVTAAKLERRPKLKGRSRQLPRRDGDGFPLNGVTND
ncbi:hypothetical protein [Leisingera sp. F5]|uniref:hypothetical protein n=1 Tax=Leisingera sp. F5 TaxID=1813816 RepID=UPI000AB78346|nr:hypothetical protein [Leisingera sp. F5]